MMRNSIATYKESLSRIASDVQGAAEELEIAAPRGEENAWIADRRASHRFAESTSPPDFPPVGNGACSASVGENGLFKQEMSANGNIHAGQAEEIQQKMITNVGGNRKEPKYAINNSDRTIGQMQAKYTMEVEELRVQLDVERRNLANAMHKCQEQQKKNEVLQKELHDLKMEKEKMSLRIKEMQNDMEGKTLEFARLQMAVNRRNLDVESNDSLERLRVAILALQNENAKIKMEKSELETILKHKMEHTQEKTEIQNSELACKSSNLSEEEEKLTKKMQQLESTLAVTCKERDKALQDLNRLKQHLLDKELEESNKMDEDHKMIEELQLNVANQRAHILKLEMLLKQESMKNEELSRAKGDELCQANEVINGLKQKMTNYMGILELKNNELLNLQTVLGQYYAETEAKGRLERDLVVAREESTKLSDLLKAANEQLGKSKKEREEIISKVTQLDRMLSEGKFTMQKLQEDNSKLRRTLEQSMTRINRMSLDSDYSVDRRIVIKLLVTYFERNHSKEVLDLMVRMLGFSEEDKQKIGVAQQVAKKGVVRGVLGFPGRIVGGILGSSSSEGSSQTTSENQSFADLWVDFLLKETEEREKREMAEASKKSSGAQDINISDHSTSLRNNYTKFETVYSQPNSIPEPPDAEFAIVPLTSTAAPSSSGKYPFLRPPPRY